MYQDMYERWLAADLDDPDLKPELESIRGDDAAIQDRFAVALKFGTAGLRGVIGAGTNRMNIYVVRQATQGLANWVKTQGGSQTVAISYDSRIKSDLFAKTAAQVLAANGIHVRIYRALMPVPALSFATRYYKCNAGIMVTASHNPAKYNGYKAYGPDGCQMTDEAADVVYAEIQKTDVLTGARIMPFAEGMEKGLIEYVGDDCINALYEAIEARSIRPGICKTAGLKLVYSPLNGSGLVPVTHVPVSYTHLHARCPAAIPGGRHLPVRQEHRGPGTADPLQCRPAAGQPVAAAHCGGRGGRRGGPSGQRPGLRPASV